MNLKNNELRRLITNEETLFKKFTARKTTSDF